MKTSVPPIGAVLTNTLTAKQKNKAVPRNIEDWRKHQWHKNLTWDDLINESEQAEDA